MSTAPKSPAVKVAIHATGLGSCSLTGKEAADGLTVTFEDGTVQNAFLSWKAFRQLLGLKTAQAKTAPKETPNGFAELEASVIE